ncbi:FtsW/RodA/SpoVE family cell cycle protein [Corynebacterium pseudodiphtheriticum]|uniref:FtsW/RodA/SpoVE family cell cycle protein n=1 Tax=Corynebacterium pseudodiphtheriticum TaxID=37637 RepID=UPI00253FD040|nr:FtsW/RodA/SpoVE family cell cycle protein [Corynebacterium pseudodiphtheriticum]MDK4321998.1 FtsW/RodA/SpoVE family cell cycle protein [Corynebacterium pseudodiphtheriticum]MDK8700594.1 FtsW/RodA/SpoVE family cell cycle protein [Corynebacterium pseudodiphtheriticum]MDK8761864.1 FtsW/RodA/SpoVE family cell cycle protein [Corynebacterium pseudodiphtheriticum]MDK8774628.1 FtsW/RodA/SpoVE family cell cycle protein [Corynebacterium pseudodiphtheriticum]
MSRIFIRSTELGLLIVAAIAFAATLASFELSQGSTLSVTFLYLVGAFIGVFTVAHIALTIWAPYADQIMLPVVSLLNGLGLIMVYRIDTAKDLGLANRQVMWSVIGVALLIAVLIIVRDHKVLTRYSYLLGALGLVLLALPLVWPTSINADARIWIQIGSFTLQPGEFSKILLLMFFAQLLVQKRALFTVAGYRFFGISFPRLRDLAPILLVWAIAILIMAVSNDFGPVLLLFSTVLGMLFMATGRWSWLIIGLGLTALGGAFVYSLSAKIQARFSAFRNPLDDVDGTGFQLSQSLFGMSWGGVTGTGLGQGHPDIIPVVWTDFILAAIGEELGLIGLTGVLILFALLVSRGFNTSLKVRDSYGKLLAAGLSLTMAIQIFVVVGGITALLPMTGLTTPFMSAGGSSLMANYVLLALLLRISNSARRPADEASGNNANTSDGHAQPAANAAPGMEHTGVFDMQQAQYAQYSAQPQHPQNSQRPRRWQSSQRAQNSQRSQEAKR